MWERLQHRSYRPDASICHPSYQLVRLGSVNQDLTARFAENSRGHRRRESDGTPTNSLCKYETATPHPELIDIDATVSLYFGRMNSQFE
jgi:hypothetical protein